MTLHDLEVESLQGYQKEHYRKCLDNGCTKQLALMLATRKGPEMGESDRTYCDHARYSMNHMGDYIQRNIIDIAQKSGINTEGKFYEGAIGKYNDPLAWVSGVDDAKAAIKKKNLSCEGLVRNKAVETKQKEIALGEDMVRSSVQEYVSAIRREKGPSWTPKRKQLGELREMVIEKHGKRKRRPMGISSGESFSRRVR